LLSMEKPRQILKASSFMSATPSTKKVVAESPWIIRKSCGADHEPFSDGCFI
jgi:hypothetical protein